MSLDIAGYLDGEGAAGILLRLDTKHGLLNGELEEQLHISPTTLSKHISEAKRLDLIKQTRRAGDHGNAKRYVLTERGGAVAYELQEHDLDDAYERLFQAHQDLEVGKEIVKNWLKDADVTHPDFPPEPERRDIP